MKPFKTCQNEKRNTLSACVGHAYAGTTQTGVRIGGSYQPTMKQGGGSLVVAGDCTNWAVVGHNSIYTFDGKDYIVYHGYDAKDNGIPKLIIQELNWDAEGWPVVSTWL